MVGRCDPLPGLFVSPLLAVLALRQQGRAAIPFPAAPLPAPGPVAVAPASWSPRDAPPAGLA